LHHPSEYAHTVRMPSRVNVYLPDDLAQQVRRVELPISSICQQALREELDKMTTTQDEITYETLSVWVGEDGHEERFRGRWLVKPDPDETRSGDEGYDAGAYFGVAQTAKGKVAVFVAHCNERWPAKLTAFSSLEEAELPRTIDQAARAALGQPIWLDI